MIHIILKPQPLPPQDLLEQGMETLVRNLGIPAELLRGSADFSVTDAQLFRIQPRLSRLAALVNVATGTPIR